MDIEGGEGELAKCPILNTTNVLWIEKNVYVLDIFSLFVRNIVKRKNTATSLEFCICSIGLYASSKYTSFPYIATFAVIFPNNIGI